MSKQASCEERIQNNLDERIADVRKLWTLFCDGDEEGDEDLGTFNEYGLAFDYVAPGTFGDQEEGYFRYQLSWGGPSDEFRFFVNPDFSVYRVEYWFLDWGDGASRRLYGEDRALLEEIFNFFDECGSTRAEYDRAVAND